MWRCCVSDLCACQLGGPATPTQGYPRVLPVCQSTDKSDAIFGNCSKPGSQPLRIPYNLSPFPLPPRGWQHWARAVVTGAGSRSSLACTWLPGGPPQQHSTMPEVLAKIPHALSLQPSVAPHCLQDESKLRPQKHLLTERFGPEATLTASPQWWYERQPSNLGGMRPLRLHLAPYPGSPSSLRTWPTVSHGRCFLLSPYPSKSGSKATS